PCLSCNRDPRGRIIHKVETEGHVGLDERWYARFRRTRAVSARQKYSLVNQNSGESSENARGNTCAVRLRPDHQRSYTGKQIVDVDSRYIVGSCCGCSCHRDEYAQQSKLIQSSSFHDRLTILTGDIFATENASRRLMAPLFSQSLEKTRFRTVLSQAATL